MHRALVSILLTLPALAQTQTFASITLKPARPGNSRMEVLPDGERIANAIPVIRLLSYAYAVPVNPSPRLSGLPDWRQDLRATHLIRKHDQVFQIEVLDRNRGAWLNVQVGDLCVHSAGPTAEASVMDGRIEATSKAGGADD